jgi:hypothetical protein
VWFKMASAAAATRSAGNVLRRYFHPKDHVWFRPVFARENKPANKHYCHIEMGLTQRGLDDIGDVTAMKAQVSNHHDVSKNEDLATIEWEGFTRSDSDELYHATWGTFSGETTLKAPVAGKVQSVNVVPNTFLIEEDTILATLTVSADDWVYEIQNNHLVSEFDYQNIVKNSAPGQFADDII